MFSFNNPIMTHQDNNTKGQIIEKSLQSTRDFTTAVTAVGLLLPSYQLTFMLLRLSSK